MVSEKTIANLKQSLAIAKLILDELHRYLHLYKVIQIIIIGFFMWLGHEQWIFFKGHHTELVEWALAGFVSMNATTLLAIQSALTSIMSSKST